jgi:uncharacterized membrane protein
MVKIERTATINAPVEKVFEYLSQPTNLPEIWPSMVEVKDFKDTPNHIGSTYNWVYKMAGMRFEGSSECVECVANKRTVSKSKGSITSTFDYIFEAVDKQTRFIMKIEYIIPIPLLGKLAETFIKKQNEHEADVFMANLKARMGD